MTLATFSETRQSDTPILDAIRARRSVGSVAAACPDRQTIEQLIESATWAPNHRLTQPWRFIVMTADARLELAGAMAEAQARRESIGQDALKPIQDAARKKVLRAPVIIAVAVEPSPDPRVPEMEEICAGAAAIQNLLLAAQDLGLAAVWRTGDACGAHEVKELLGLVERAHLLGLIYVGYPLAAPPARPRQPITEVTSWRGWAEAGAS